MDSSKVGVEVKQLSARELSLVQDAFNVFDTKGNGKISYDEFEKAMRSLFRLNRTDDELEKLYKFACPNPRTFTLDLER